MINILIRNEQYKSIHIYIKKICLIRVLSLNKSNTNIIKLF